MNRFNRIWVGTGGINGIHVLQRERGRWRVLTHGGPEKATFLTHGPNSLVLAAIETDLYGDTPGGAVVSCRMRGGKLEVCGQVKGLSRGLCQLAFAPKRRLLFAASYPEGSVDVVKLEPDGTLIAGAHLERHGNGPHPEQTGPHAHCCVVTRNEDLFYVCDLGSDEIARYNIENLKPFEPIRLPPGTGPRHLILSQDEAYAYVSCELSNQVLVVRTSDGAVIQTISCQTAAEHFCALSSIRFSAGGNGLVLGCRGVDGVWLIPIEAPGQLGQPAFFLSASRFPWDVLPLEDGNYMTAFTNSNCIEIGVCKGGNWETKDTIEIQSPTYLLGE